MTSPHLVNSPIKHWKLQDVLIDGGDKIGSDSLAIGFWDDLPRLASRWDQTPSSDKGNPFSRVPTWYVLPEWMEVGVLQAANLTDKKRQTALNFLQSRKA